ncbi:MAG: hypothetical protein KJP07_10100 [Desulfatitalea sp.]|nr:hypothetical protein [Desulfatitalea sp.]
MDEYRIHFSLISSCKANIACPAQPTHGHAGSDDTQSFICEEKHGFGTMEKRLKSLQNTAEKERLLEAHARYCKSQAGLDGFR